MWLLGLSASQAVIVLADSFTYADGAITNGPNSPWTAHSGSGANQNVLIASGKVQLNSSRGEDVNATLTNQPYTVAGGAVLYSSFTVNFSALPTAAGSYFAHFNPGSNHRARVWASTSAGSLRLGIGNSTSTDASTGPITNILALNTTYTIVTRYNVGTGLSTIWLNPTAESDLSVTAVDAVGLNNITAYSFRQAAGIGTLLLDDLKVGTTFAEVAGPANQPPSFTAQPQNQTVGEGATVNFGIGVQGTQPLSYQWWFNTNTILPTATNQTLVLANVLTNQSGNYSVAVSNAFGITNSQYATLSVIVIPPYQPAALSLLTYNVKGNGATDWSTNAPQVESIGRQVSYLRPDIITFQEIPYALSYEMTNFMKVYLPGYSLVTNSGTDGSIRSMIASRFQITRSSSWLDGQDLRAFGYSNANNSLDNFTRDLFEAQINVPNFPQPLHVFTAHLKSSQDGYTNAAAKRAAEAAAITNFFATNFFVLYPNHPCVLTGDMNEADTNTLAIQRLVGAGTGLRMMNPTNPFTGSTNTSGSARIDYIFPNTLLSLNVSNSQVFRTDQLNPTPPSVQSADSDASDHWPVLMVFNNPYDKPFRLLSIARTNASVSLKWESVPGQPYRVDNSSNLTAWSALASNLVATSNSYTFTTSVSGNAHFFRIYRVP